MYKKDTENYDIGRIDIFLREKKQQHVKSYSFRQISINGFRAKSRFGTSLAKLGDINDDGFNGNLGHIETILKHKQSNLIISN
jgi:hypothetical protein